MRRFLLDTHILVWHLEGSTNIDKNIVDEIESFRGNCYVSVESLREIVILQKLGKIELPLSIEGIIEKLEYYNMMVLTIESKHINVLESLSSPTINGKTHDDPFDRMLISQSIAEKLTLISSDKKFPFYKDKGFHLLENSY